MIKQDNEWLQRRLQELAGMLEDVMFSRTPLAGQPVSLEIVRREILEYRQWLATAWDNNLVKTLDRLETTLVEVQNVRDKRKADATRRRAAALGFAGLTIQ